MSKPGKTKVARRPSRSKEMQTLSGLTGPTILTMARMALSVVFMILVMIPALPARILAILVFIAGAISDLIDGKWARKHAKVTDLGAFLDPLADKMLVDLAFLALVAMDIVPVWVFALILVRDLAVDGMRMMAAREGVTIAASFYGKLKTTTQLTALIMILANLVLGWSWFWVLCNIALYLALAMTLISGADYLIKNWRKVIVNK